MFIIHFWDRFECTDEYNFINGGGPIAQIGYDKDRAFEDVHNECQYTCLTTYPQCIAFWIQEQGTNYLCGYHYAANLMENRGNGAIPGQVCTQNPDEPTKAPTSTSNGTFNS